MNIIQKEKERARDGERVFFPSPLGSLFENVFSSENLVAKVPSVNIYETEQEFVLEFSAPGFKKENFAIELEKDLLSISGTKQKEESAEKRSYSRREFSTTSFKRSFSVPEIVDTEKISASYEDGMLKVAMTKRDEAKPKPPRSISIS